MTDLCTYSDLPADTCSHCLGHALDGIAPTPAEPDTAPAAVIWSPTKARHAATIAHQRPSTLKVDPSPTSAANGPQNANPCRCGRPLHNNHTACDHCAERLNRALGDIPWLDEELDVTITKQRAASTEGGSRGATTGLPWHEEAADAKRHLHALLVSWTRLCDEEGVAHQSHHNELPDDNLPALSRWLMWRTDGLAKHDAGPDVIEEITDAVTTCERLIFWKRRNRLYLGPCTWDNDNSDCPGDIYAGDRDPVGTCDTCERGVTVVTRQAKLDDEMAGRLLAAADIADWVMRMGINANRDEVRKRVLYWHRRQRIEAASHEQRGATKIPLFRYADVRDLIREEYADAIGA